MASLKELTNTYFNFSLILAIKEFTIGIMDTTYDLPQGLIPYNENLKKINTLQLLKITRNC
jgi:hypothetical protein